MIIIIKVTVTILTLSLLIMTQNNVSALDVQIVGLI